MNLRRPFSTVTESLVPQEGAQTAKFFLGVLDSRSIHPMLSCLEVLEPPGVLCDCMTVHKVTGISRIREDLGFGH